MVLVNTLSCAQPGRACGQREGEELAAPTAGQADGRTDRRAGSPAQPSQGPEWSSCSRRHGDGDRTMSRQRCSMAALHAPAPTQPLHTHTHPCARAHTRGLGLPAGEEAESEDGAGGKRGAASKEGQGEAGRRQGLQLQGCKLEQESHPLTPTKDTFYKTSQFFRGSCGGALDSHVTEVKGFLISPKHLEPKHLRDRSLRA